MISWVRIDRGIAADPKIHRMADELQLDVPGVVGRLTLVFAQMAEHAQDGAVGDVPDSALEEWAMWRGKRGRFAAIFRTVLAPEGTVTGWAKHNGAAIDKAERDARRLADRRANDARRSRDSGASERGSSRVDVTRRNELRTDVGIDRPAKHSHSPPKRAADAAVRVLEPEAFASAWALYPRRAGGNPRRDAESAWSARVREGVSPAAMVDGARRYAAFCAAEQQVGTRYVMQAARFFGPSHPFAEAWDASPEPEDRGAQLLAEQDAREAADAAWLAERRVAVGVA